MKQKKTKSRSKEHLRGANEGEDEDGGEDEGEDEDGGEGEDGEEEEEEEEEHPLPPTLPQSCRLLEVTSMNL